ncbi:MAG: sigma-70 family RNA polymerase sigma factor [Ruminococcaceae bacterium]|nr:sigma-70 family RNA polymerase sigma factor [Oscillospiraceae bacterium]
MIDKITADRIAQIHYKDVFSFCLTKLENKYEEEDLTQDTFLAFQLKTDALNDDHIVAWLINTANNLIKHYFRDHKRFIQEELNESHLTVEDIFECIERENPVTPEIIEEQKERVLSTLNEKETEFFNKRYIEHKSYREIAEEINISEKAAKVYCCRLRTKIIDEAKLITSAWILLVAKIFFENF